MGYRFGFLKRFTLVSSLGLLLAVPGLEQTGFAQQSSTPTSGGGSSSPSNPTATGGNGQTSGSPSADTADARFACQTRNGQYTVMYLPQSQPNQAYAWAIPGDMGSAWPAERRCQEISKRLELYRPDGLVEMKTGVENGYNTVCVTTEKVPGCRIVFTVPSGQDPTATRDRVFENLAMADRGETTQGVNTFAEGSNNILGQIGSVLNLPGNSGLSSSSGINLKPFLDPLDGGTGARLTPGSGTSGRSLNPDNFR